MVTLNRDGRFRDGPVRSLVLCIIFFKDRPVVSEIDSDVLCSLACSRHCQSIGITVHFYDWTVICTGEQDYLPAWLESVTFRTACCQKGKYSHKTCFKIFFHMFSVKLMD